MAASGAKRRIERFLAKHGKDVTSVNASLIHNLEKVDVAIQTRSKKIADAKKICKENAINLSRIAADAHISRKTLYNNPLLQEYINESKKQLNNDTVSSDEIKEMKEEVASLNKTIDDFVHRDVNTENVLQENVKLKAEMENLRILNQNLETQYGDLLEKYEKALGQLPPNVIPFDDKKN